MVFMPEHNYSLFANPFDKKHNQLQFAISYAYVYAVSSSKKKKKVKNLMDHSDLDLANFEAICTKTPPYSSLASSNFINGMT